MNHFRLQPLTAAMAFRTASFSLRRMISTSAVRSSEMSVTFGGPNAVFYNKATNIKQVWTQIFFFEI